MEYNFRDIEAKWRESWKQDHVYKVNNPLPGEVAKPKFYVLDMFPYPSGAGLHVGHPLGYIASDIYSRYKRLKGFNVLHPMGFDSFGLPAEQYAIETGQHPATTTEKNIATFKAQLDKIGFCYDWDREVRTSDPDYYKWTQWIFLQLFNSYFCNTEKKARPVADLIKKYETKGAKDFTATQWNAYTKKEQEDILMKRRLAFSAYGEVNWCEALGTVLANDEVVNGVSERGGFPVVKKKMRQWYLRITAYADRLLDGLEKVEFSESMKEMQRNWIGKSEGAEIEFRLTPSSSPAGDVEALKVYTTRPDTIFGVDFLVLAPEHELVNKITTAEQRAGIDEYLTYVKSRSDRERMAEVKQITGCFTGAYADHPFTGKPIPIWIAEYVLAGYGTGAIMAVPCGDQRDFAFAKHFNIPITNIIGNSFTGEEANPTKEATLQNSDFLNGLLMKDAITVAINKIEADGIGKRKINYRMRDAGFSRQRYWGEPFPIVWQDAVAIPLHEDELPLELPYVEKYGPGPEGEGPLANIEEWVHSASVDPGMDDAKIRRDINFKNRSDAASVNLTPSPSPKERGMEKPSSFGYVNSSETEWRNTIAFVKENRKNPTAEEDIIWQELRNRQVDGFKFRRQHPVAGYNPDFVCLEKKLIIEIDGEYHNADEQKIFDNAREQWLNEYGYTMIRFSNADVKSSLPFVIQKIKEQLSKNTNILTESVSHSPFSGRGTGGEVRETSTMPGYAGSSWYFLRYMDPKNDKTFCDRNASDYWNQVDVYIGGTEHAVGHLLYSRMWTKVMYDLNLIGFDEPFKKLVNQGMIQGSSRFVYRITPVAFIDNSYIENDEVIPAFISFSHYIKATSFLLNPLVYLEELYSKYNWNKEFIDNNEKVTQGLSVLHVDVNFVNGTELDIDKFRKWKPDFENAIFLLEDGSVSLPYVKYEGNSKYICGTETEKMSKSKYNTVNPNDLVDKYGADTFRMYEMFLGPVEASKPWDTKGIEGVHRFLKKLWRLFFDEQKGKIWNTDKPTDAELKVLHKTIKKIESDTESFSFNTAVSAFMISVNELADLKCYKKEILEQVLILLVPYAPHIAEELWHQLGNKGTILNADYPMLEEKYLIESSKEYPISINGKMRTTISIDINALQPEVEKIVLQNDIVQKWLEGKSPKKIIFVKGKMVNVVI